MVPHGQAMRGWGEKGLAFMAVISPPSFRGDKEQDEEIRNRTGGRQPLRGQKAAADSERWDGRVGEGRVMVPAPQGHGVMESRHHPGLGFPLAPQGLCWDQRCLDRLLWQGSVQDLLEEEGVS